MGDLIEISINSHVQSLIYKVPFGCLKVDIKSTRGNAVIGLFESTFSGSQYWITIGHNGRTWISNNECLRGKIVLTPDILTENEYRSFWAIWCGQSLRFGRHGETRHIASMKIPLFTNLNYALFSMNDVPNNSNIVHYRFEAAPVIKKPISKPINGGVVHWLRYENNLPQNSIIGGHEKKALYIIRAKHNNSLVIGKLLMGEERACISYRGETYEKDDFEILIGYDYSWVPTYQDVVPVGAVVGGYSEQNGEKLYIGRARQDDHLIPGYVQVSNAACYIAYKGKEISHVNYEVLAGPCIHTRCVNHKFRFHIYVERPPQGD